MGTAPCHSITLLAQHLLIQQILLSTCYGCVPSGRSTALFNPPLTTVTGAGWQDGGFYGSLHGTDACLA